MSEQPKALEEIKQDFVSRVSHDLKSPLASIREAIHILLEEIPGPLTEKQRRLLTLSRQSAERLSRMIGNLLDLSQMETGRVSYEFEEKRLGEILESIVPEAELAGREKGIEIHYDGSGRDITVACDRDRMIQVLQNLLDNAVKFSPQDGVVILHVEHVRKPPGALPEKFRDEVPYAVISVADFGPGIPDSEKERIFEQFHQSGESKTQRSAGVGLGLSICRRILEAHAGAIWVEDRKDGRGSVFKIALPSAVGTGAAKNNP